MKELQRRQKVRRALYSWPSLILLGLMTVFLVKGAVAMARIERDNAQKVSDLEAQSQKIADKEQSLTEEIAKLKTDDGIKEEIRSKFSVAQDGEHMAVIVDRKPDESSDGSSTVEWLKSAWQKVESLWSR